MSHVKLIPSQLRYPHLMNLNIVSPEGIFEASVDLPLSKSMSARALIINKIGGFNLEPKVSECDDINDLNLAIRQTNGKVNVGQSGAALRFLLAYYAATPGSDVLLDGWGSISRRPISLLVDALRNLGADIEYCDKEGYAPVHVKGCRLAGGELTLDATVSSQFVSALMMIAPLMNNPLVIRFDGEPSSLSYIKMTARMMTDCGVEPEFTYNGLLVPNTPYTCGVEKVERDWSAASYWYAMAALSAGWVTLNDISRHSIQGDSAIMGIAEKLGVLTDESEDVEGALELSASPEVFSRLDLDMSSTPDLVPTLAVLSAALGIPFRFTGVHTLRHKESDRLEALCDEALKIGLVFEIERGDVLSWEGKRVPIHEIPTISTHGDHRIAMAFAPVAILIPAINIENAEVVSKSYPDFWVDMEQAGFIITRTDGEPHDTADTND